MVRALDFGTQVVQINNDADERSIMMHASYGMYTEVMDKPAVILTRLLLTWGALRTM